MSLYDLFLGGLELTQSYSLHHTLGKMILGYIPVYEQIKLGYYDGRLVHNHKAAKQAILSRNDELFTYFISINRHANDWNDMMCNADFQCC
jgi:hypothetical protein